MERIGVDLMIVTVIGKICREFDKRNKRAPLAHGCGVAGGAGGGCPSQLL